MLGSLHHRLFWSFALLVNPTKLNIFSPFRLIYWSYFCTTTAFDSLFHYYNQWWIKLQMKYIQIQIFVALRKIQFKCEEILKRVSDNVDRQQQQETDVNGCQVVANARMGSFGIWWAKTSIAIVMIWSPLFFLNF